MKNVIKNERGVSLISLAVAIILLGIITSMLLYNVKDTKDIERVTNMYIDIEGISDRVSNYYTRYGALPVLNEIDLSNDSTISNWISERNSNSNEGPLGKNDSDKFYVIDLKALENLSLNYGSGFAKITDSTLPSDKDVYVINEKSHNIFYLHGIKINNNGVIKMYYTNQDKDTATVDIRYVDGVKIPDGFSYKSGSTKNDFKIQDGNTVEYSWANIEDNEYSVQPSSSNYNIVSSDSEIAPITIAFASGQNIDDLKTSYNEFGGFYFNALGNVYYHSISEDDNWGPVYDVAGVYTDKNGDKAYIPAGFKMNKLSSLNTINKGLVIKNDSTGDEYVWIDVPDKILANARTLDEIEKALKNYAKDYREDGYEDTYQEGLVMTNDSTKNNKVVYNELKNKMLQSIKENGGFYIGRYEAGKGSNNTVITQRDARPWNEITIKDAQIASNDLSTDSYTASLMFGIQWDLVCKFLEETGVTYNDIAKNSKDWGNYCNSIFKLNRGEYQSLSNWNLQADWKAYTEDNAGYVVNKQKQEISFSSGIIYTTGACEQNKKQNIYDLAGNVNEYTLEMKKDTIGGRTRGGCGCYTGNQGVAWRFTGQNNSLYAWLHKIDGFRVTLFKEPLQTGT